MRRRTIALALALFAASSPPTLANQQAPAVTLGSIQAKLFYHQSARFSDDILNRAEPFTGWNTVIGEGEAEEAADDLLVLLPVTAQGEAFSDAPIDLWVTNDQSKVVAKRTFASVLTSGAGKATLALWLTDVGCAGDLTFHARSGKQERTAKLALNCGE